MPQVYSRFISVPQFQNTPSCLWCRRVRREVHAMIQKDGFAICDQCVSEVHAAITEELTK